MIHKRVFTHAVVLLLVLGLVIPGLPLRAARPHRPARPDSHGRGDGHADLAAGAVDVIDGYSDWPGGGIYGLSQDTGSVPGMAELDDHLGMALAVGDFHGAHVYLPLVTRAGSRLTVPAR
jgi:hypothetical protein